MDERELASLLSTHAAHRELIQGGFVVEIAPERYQLVDPPALIRALHGGALRGRQAQIAAGLLFQCKPPKGFWVAGSPEELLDRIRSGQEPL